MSSQEVYTLTIQPGFSEWEEPIRQYISRTNYGPNMTIYTIDNEKSALFQKKKLEMQGFIVHLEEPNSSTTSTNYQKIYAGISLNSNQ